MLDPGLDPNGRSSQLYMLNTSIGHMAASDAFERIVNVKLGTDSARHVLAFTLHRKMQAKEWTTEFRVLENQYFSSSHIITQLNYHNCHCNFSLYVIFLHA
jgi:hypothetical protein